MLPDVAGREQPRHGRPHPDIGRDVPGLVRKYYLFNAEAATGGGIYLWKSREDAERTYTAEWKRMIRERYGAEPRITYFDTPVVVDNATGEISSHRMNVRAPLALPETCSTPFDHFQ